MKAVSLAFASLILSVLLVPALGAEGDDKTKRVDALLQEFDGQVPGVSVLVVRDGRAMYNKAFGLANVKRGIKIGPETRFRLASVSKQFTAMAIMILARCEMLDYDDPLPLFFPNTRFPDGAGRITVRTLLQHSSGLPEYDELFLEKGLISDSRPRSSKKPREQFEPKSRDVFKILSCQRALKFPPGAAAEYSNSGYVLLGEIIEKVSGETYGAFLHHAIFDPLQMTQTIVSDGTTPNVENRAISYARNGASFDEIDYTPLNGVFGDDGVYTTIGDMRKWVDALDRGVLVGEDTMRLAFARGRLNSGESTEYGFGWMLDRYLDQRLIWHNGEWIGFRTYIGRYPARKLTIVVLANCRDTNVDHLGDQVAAIYLDRSDQGKGNGARTREARPARRPRRNH